jgi:hypothetical protein
MTTVQVILKLWAMPKSFLLASTSRPILLENGQPKTRAFFIDQDHCGRHPGLANAKKLLQV